MIVAARAAAALLALLALVAGPPLPAAAQDANVSFVWDEVVYAGAESPGNRRDAAVGYDRVRNRLIVFGGQPGPSDETWQFDLATRVWTELATASDAVRPEARFSVVAGMDEARGRFLVTTGEGRGKKHFNDVWAFDLATDTWSEVATSGPKPEVRYGASGGTFVFGADYLIVTHGFASTRFDNTFALRLADDTWESLTPGSCPFKRCLQGGVVTRDNRLTIYGGCGSGGFGPCPAFDAWTLTTQASSGVPPSRDAARWDELDQCPGPRLYTSLQIAPGNPEGTNDPKRLVLFGGAGGIHGSGSSGEVGVLDLADGGWTLLSPAGDAKPSVRRQTNLVYVNHNADSVNASDYVIAYGGNVGGGDMWRLSLDPARPEPSTKDCPPYFDLRMFHGVTMFLSWGFLLPIGVFVARFGRHWPNTLWFRLHRPLQMVGVVLQLAGFIAAFLMLLVGHFSYQPHSGIGAAVFLFGTAQPINAYFRPHIKPGEEPSKNRRRWEHLHRWAGRACVLLGMLNIFGGLTAIRARNVFVVLYSVWFTAYWAAYIALSLLGEPTRSPAAQWMNEKLLCSKGRLNLGGSADVNEVDPNATEMEKTGKESEF